MLAEIFLPAGDTTSGSAAGATLDTDTLGEEETITDWLAFSGDYVHKGQVLGHAEIRGAVVDIAAPFAGVLHILVPVDRPLPALSLVGVIDTAPDARSFSVTFTPAEPPPVEPAPPAPVRLEWTVNLATPTPWTAGPDAASSPPMSPRDVAAAPAAAPDQGLPLAPDSSLQSGDRRPPGSDLQDTPRAPATRLPLLSRQTATPQAQRQPMDTPINQPSPPDAAPAPLESQGLPETPPVADASEQTPLPANVPSAYPASTPRTRLYASPRARTLARQTGVDVISVQGSGPFGRVEEEDVRQYLDAHATPGAPATRPQGSEAAPRVETGSVIVIETTAAIIPETAESPAPIPAPPTSEPTPPESPVPVSEPVSVETAPAEHAPTEHAPTEHAPTEHAPTEPPRPEASFASPEPRPDHVLPTGQTATLAVQVDATDLMLMRERLTTGIQKRTGEPLTYHVMLAKLVAVALRDHPALNARQTDQGFQIMPNLDLGLATDTLPGQAVPVLSDAGSKDLLTLSREAAVEAHRARPDGGIPATPRAASFTIVNLSDGGVELCTPALPHPQCAALGLGRIAPRPVVQEGQIVVRPTVFLSLTYQATVISAAQAAGFLARLAALLEDPAPLAEGLIY